MDQGRSRRGGWVLLGLGVAYALVQLSRGVYFSRESADLQLSYTQWQALMGGQPAPLPHLPHAHLLFSVLFAAGFAVARPLMLALNLALVVSIWHRLSRLLELQGLARWLLLILFCDWTCVRATIGHGQLALVVLAALLWAFPSRSGSTLGLVVASVKHSLSFPIFLALVVQRPRRLVVPAVVIAAGLGWAMWWLGLGPLDYLALLREGMSPRVTGAGATNLSLALATAWGRPLAAAVVVWSLWFAALGYLLSRIHDELILWACLLVMSLWPVYHQHYDLVVLAPALAVLLRGNHRVGAALLTLALAGPYEHLTKMRAYDLPWLEAVLPFYYPLLLLGLLGALAGLDRGDRISRAAAPPGDRVA